MLTKMQEIKKLAEDNKYLVKGEEDLKERMLENETEGRVKRAGLNVIAYSMGTYGINGLVIYDYEKGDIYALPGRGWWVMEFNA